MDLLVVASGGSFCGSRFAFAAKAEYDEGGECEHRAHGGKTERLHDGGAKTVLGSRIAAGGMEDGLHVIDLLARHPATARFIARKLARRFVADEPPLSVIDRAAETFRRSDGDIRAVIRSIFEAPEFFAPEFYQAKVKKPLEYVASSMRLLQAETRVTPQLLRYLARMGEPLFLAQPPTGYPDIGASWVSADMLLTRMNFAADLVANRINGARVPAQPSSDGVSSRPAGSIVTKARTDAPSVGSCRKRPVRPTSIAPDENGDKSAASSGSAGDWSGRRSGSDGPKRAWRARTRSFGRRSRISTSMAPPESSGSSAVSKPIR